VSTPPLTAGGATLAVFAPLPPAAATAKQLCAGVSNIQSTVSVSPLERIVARSIRVLQIANVAGPRNRLLSFFEGVRIDAPQRLPHLARKARHEEFGQRGISSARCRNAGTSMGNTLSR